VTGLTNLYKPWHDFLYKVKIINLKNNIMRSLLYIIAVILVIGWAIGVFAYSAGGIIHVLLVIAVIALIIGLIRGDTSVI
jgi:hypothetical protein